MKNSILQKILVFIAIICASTIINTACKSKKAQQQQAPAFKVMEIKGTKVPIYLQMVGQAIGLPTVEIRARVAGYLKNWSFQEGSMVRKGQPLFTIEQDEYINDVKFAEADLDNKIAAWEKAKLDVARLKPLLSTNAISQNDYDKAVTTEQQDRAMVASSRANLDQAKLNLSYTNMPSPITGYIGACNVRPGNLVGKGESTLLSTVSAVDPIYVNFQMNENDYLKIMRYQEAHKAELKDRKDLLKVYLTLSDNMLFDHIGKIDFIDRDINPQTGTIALRAVFENPDGLIKPGNFANVNLVLYEDEQGIVIPQGATTQIQGKNFAFLVDNKNKVNRVPIVLGMGIGNKFIVGAGLKLGDRIMLEGFQKFQEGMQITPVMVPDTLTVPLHPATGN
ncbi:MAG: efflux RND transporter periplasmic adaptor subunit [Bacteroidales bacterium]|jgi:membrane fusion protein (multidrug efflux system)|nr:efflux RND transporter periplasmic adaptor subunit [Bacteroidales bacterium]